MIPGTKPGKVVGNTGTFDPRRESCPFVTGGFTLVGGPSSSFSLKNPSSIPVNGLSLSWFSSLFSSSSISGPNYFFVLIQNSKKFNLKYLFLVAFV
jgi:hypothetical protein